MNKNKKFDIVPYICIVGLAFAMLIVMLYMYKTEVAYADQKQKVNDMALVMDMLVKDIEEINIGLEEQKRIQIEMQTQMQEMSIATIEEEVMTCKATINYDYEYVLRVVAAESRGEPLEGQMAVAQCIRETSRATGMTPEEVVKQINPNGTRQYSVPVEMDLVNDSVREACERVFIKGESAVDEPIRYFYSIRNGGYSSWHENSLEYVITIGNHKFFKAK